MLKMAQVGRKVREREREGFVFPEKQEKMEVSPSEGQTESAELKKSITSQWLWTSIKTRQERPKGYSKTNKYNDLENIILLTIWFWREFQTAREKT